MFFRNIITYRLPQGWPLTAEEFSEHLARAAFQPCGASDLMSVGWVAPQENRALVLSVNGQFLVTLKRETKLLPSRVVKQAATERAKKIESEQGRKVGRKEMKELQESATLELLPRAFTSVVQTSAWIDPVNGWISVDASTPAKAEEVLELLRKSITPAPQITLMKLTMSPSSAMTLWLSPSAAPSQFTVDQDLELSSLEKSKVRYVKHALEGEDILQHIAAGKTATKLAMTWNDRISFVLTESAAIKRISFLDILKKDQAENQADSKEEQFDLDFTLMAGELARLHADLVSALGGELPQ